MGTNEDAARKRIARAVEKLRSHFSKRGLTLTATVIASAVAANSVQAAPVGLAVKIKAASLAAATTGTFSLLKFMNISKLKLGFNAIVVAGVTVAFVIQHQAQSKLQRDNESLHQQIAQLQTDNQNLADQLAAAGKSKLLSDAQFNELLRLRGEVGRLRHQSKALLETKETKTNSLPEVVSILLQTKFLSLPTEDVSLLGVGWSATTQGGKTGLLTGQQLKVINEALQDASDAKFVSAPRVVVINGNAASMSVTQTYPVGGTNANLGTSLSVTPYFLTNSSTFNLNLGATLSVLTGDPAQPGVQTIQVTNQITLSPGQTMVLENEIPSSCWLPDSTNIPTGPRSLLVFVTPTVVDTRNVNPNQ
jgi:hypothetical protein